MYYVKCKIKNFIYDSLKFNNECNVVMGKFLGNDINFMNEGEANQLIFRMKDLPHNFMSIEKIHPEDAFSDTDDVIRDRNGLPVKAILSAVKKGDQKPASLNSLVLIQGEERSENQLNLPFTVLAIFEH